LCECPYDRKIKGPLQRSLSFKLPFPKIKKVEERKDSWVSESLHQIKTHGEWDIYRWTDPRENRAHPSHLIEEENEVHRSLSFEGYCGPRYCSWPLTFTYCTLVVPCLHLTVM
jgi:hypothetical protein